jgi:hypothetical protein
MMIMVCLACAALAVWLTVPPPARSDRMTVHAERQSAGRSAAGPSRWSTLGAVAGSGLLVMSGLLLDGVRGAVLSLALVVVGGTVAGLTRQRRRRRSALKGRVEVARACAALAAQLRVGQVPS